MQSMGKSFRHELRVTLVLLGAVLALGRFAPGVEAQDPAAPVGDRRTNRADYRIEATVDDATRHLDGRETLTWTNRSGEGVQDLWFHLYLNAFSNNRSTHLTESKGLLRGHKKTEGWGWQRVRSVVVRDAAGAEHDVSETFRYRWPDTEPNEDRTVFSVDLPFEVADGESIEVDIVWESMLPRVRRRTGVKGDFIYCAQWFPKLGVYEGGRGWNCHQFHMNTEFYSNYGHYDVTLKLPEKYYDAENDVVKVGASGVLEKSEVVGGQLVVQFLAPSLADRNRPDSTGRLPKIHDFAWTADPDYVVTEKPFRFSEWASRDGLQTEVERVYRTLGRDRRDVIGEDVIVRLMIQPERANQTNRHFEATAATLFYYGLWFGPYPYQQVTVVDPAWGARAAGGMEYPTIFTCGSRLFTRPAHYTPEGVTVHECGHQFWYGLVGNNEPEAAWLDEGLNSYTDSEVLFRHYGPSVSSTDYLRIPIDGVRLVEPPGSGRDAFGKIITGRDIPIPFLDTRLSPLAGGGLLDFFRDQPFLSQAPQHTDPRWGDRTSFMRDPGRDPVTTSAWQYVDSTSYRVNSYPRPAVLLRSLPGVVGHDKFLKGMRHYAETWRYRHPYPEDFFQAFIEGSGEDVQWYFDELFQGTGTVDWSVTVSQTQEDEVRGVFQDEGTGEFIPTPDPDSDVDSEGVTDEGTDDSGEPEGPVESGGEPGEDSAEEAPQDMAESEGSEPEESVDVDTDARIAPQPGDAPRNQIEILVAREGEIRLPLDVEIEYEDGEREIVSWSREAQLNQRWLAIERLDTRRVVAVRIDPARDYYIDLDMSNNQWFDAVDNIAPLRWSERVFSQVAHTLRWYSAIGG